MNGVESSTITDAVFWAVSVLAIVFAILVVAMRDIFKAALFLALSFIAVAGMFVLLRAEFIAVVQIMVYVGAISILIVFAIVLVRDIPGGGREHKMYAPAVIIAGILAVAVVMAAWRSDFTDLDSQAEKFPLIAAGTTKSYDSVPIGDTDQIEVTLPADGEGDNAGVFVNTSGTIGELFIRDFVLPFEAVSVLLLAGMIGSLALLRSRSDA